MSGSEAFDPLGLLRALHDAGVEYVLIGGVAARLHGSPSLTRDLDICHSRERSNLERLAAVLTGLHARLRGVDDDVPFLLDARTLLAGANFTFITDAGDLDLLAAPAGVTGYDELAAHAVGIELAGFTVYIARLDDLIRMKQAAGRPKDRVEVEILSALRDEIAEGDE
jgi:predicted nucleotidyltransferase